MIKKIYIHEGKDGHMYYKSGNHGGTLGYQLGFSTCSAWRKLLGVKIPRPNGGKGVGLEISKTKIPGGKRLLLKRSPASGSPEVYEVKGYRGITLCREKVDAIMQVSNVKSMTMYFKVIK